MADRERWKRGQAFTRRRLNRTVEELERGNFVQGGAGALVTHQGGKTVHEARRRGATLSSGGQSKKVTITSMEDDYLVCAFVGGGAVNVAKPYGLRRTPFDGNTIVYENGDSISYDYTTNYASEKGRRRDATLGAETEIQEVTPNYYVGEELTVLNIDTGLLDGSGDPVAWEDKNTFGRSWVVF